MTSLGFPPTFRVTDSKQAAMERKTRHTQQSLNTWFDILKLIRVVFSTCKPRGSQNSAPHESCGSVPSFSGRQLLQIFQARLRVEQLLVERQREVQVDHGGVVDGQPAGDANQVKPVVLYETLLRRTHMC